MDTRYLAHLAADADFYDLAWADHGEADLTVEIPGIERRWRREERGPWLIYRDDAPVPDSGWKVHVALRPERARIVVPAVVRSCLYSGVATKTLRSSRLVRVTQAKYAPAAGSGKVVTAYPAGEDALESLLDTLTELLRGEPGVRLNGEVPVPGTPISLRFGAFRGLWVAGPDGHAAPGLRTPTGPALDRRAGPRPVMTEVPMPAVVGALQTAAGAADRGETLDIRDAVLLHRSTAGGVYRAVWSDGRTLVVKEARHHTGFDGGGTDAATRLRHEHAVLERLRGTGVAPEPISLRTVGASDFLLMEYIEGRTAATSMATTHPAVVPGAPAGSAAGYRQWAAGFLDRTREALDILHARGVVHRDLHPGNLIDTGDRVVLIDLESSSLDGVGISDGVRNGAGVADGKGQNGDGQNEYGQDRNGQNGDLLSLERLRTLLVNPLGVLLDVRPDLADTLRRVGEADLDRDGAFSSHAIPDGLPTAATPGLANLADRIFRGIGVCATPGRPTRLFPGDIAQFVTPHAELGLLHGAGGVLLAIAATGRTVPDEWTDRLLDDCDGAGGWTRGLADGVDGTAMCLALLGHRTAATALAGRLTDAADGELTTSPWWAAGRTGMAVAAAELAVTIPDPRLAELTRRHVATVVDSIDSPVVPPGHRPGLLTGWAGVALGLLRVAELSADRTLARDCRSAAHSAVLRELTDGVLIGGGMLMRDRTRVMPYLGIGSAATGLAASSLDAVGEPVDPGVAAAVATTLRRPVVLGAGLLLGRAGILLTLDRLSPGDPAVAGHRERLNWHSVAPRDESRRGRDPQALLVLGEQNLRCSSDLGTGAAGVLLALAGGVGSGTDPLCTVLRLPSGAPATGEWAGKMTVVIPVR